MFYKHFNFFVDFKNHSEGLSAGVIIGIVAASCVVVILIVVAIWKMGFLGGKDIRNKGKI